MKHFLAVAILFATSYVATTNGLGTTLPDGGILLDFEIQRGDTYDTLSLENRPNLYKRDSGLALTLRNHIITYIATVEVGSNNQKNTVIVDTTSSYIRFIAKEVNCLITPEFDSYFKKRSRRDYISHQDDENFAERDYLGDYSSSIGSETSVYGMETGNATDIVASTATGSSSGDTTTNTCTNFGSFETSLSSSFKRNETAYFLGDYEEIRGQDSMKIGSITVDSVAFAIANQTRDFFGVFGLGLDGYIGAGENLSFPALLKQQGAINKAAYSLYLNAVSAKTGSVLFGAVDHAKYSGTLVTVPMIESYVFDGSMYVMVDGISMGDGSNEISMTSNKYAALLSSGTTFTYVPESLFHKIGDTLGGDYSEELDYYTVNCPKVTDDFPFKFNLSGLTISVPYSNLVTADYSNSTGIAYRCILGILPSWGDDIQLGDNFLSSAYVVYDLEDLTISLAQAKYTDESDIEVISSSIPRASKASLYSSTYYETGIEESSAETIFSYETGTFTSYDITAETGIFEATEIVQTGSNMGTGSSSSSSASTSSTTKSSGEVQTVKYTLISNLIASAFGLFILVAF